MANWPYTTNRRALAKCLQSSECSRMHGACQDTIATLAIGGASMPALTTAPPSLGRNVYVRLVKLQQVQTFVRLKR